MISSVSKAHRIAMGLLINYYRATCIEQWERLEMVTKDEDTGEIYEITVRAVIEGEE